MKYSLRNLSVKLLFICVVISADVNVKSTWKQQLKHSSAHAIKGRRYSMEDRFFIQENINSTTNISIFSIFDGHAGDAVANYVADTFMKELTGKIFKIQELKLKNQESLFNDISACGKLDEISTTTSPKDESNETDKSQNQTTNSVPKVYEDICYIDNDEINYGRLITDEILSTDYKLVNMLRLTQNYAGSTALIAIIDDSKLIVANIGDSRGVMCDHLGATIPLSFDHKPNVEKENKRIKDAGGFISNFDVWRVNGNLAVSRALGDYELKPNFVIANPDILEFDLDEYRPQFVILASDGLWDTFSNEEAVEFIKEHINEPDFGAKSIVLDAFEKGSYDNISVIIVVFKNGKLEYRVED